MTSFHEPTRGFFRSFFFPIVFYLHCCSRQNLLPPHTEHQLLVFLARSLWSLSLHSKLTSTPILGWTGLVKLSFCRGNLTTSLASLKSLRGSLASSQMSRPRFTDKSSDLTSSPSPHSYVKDQFPASLFQKPAEAPKPTDLVGRQRQGLWIPE